MSSASSQNRINIQVSIVFLYTNDEKSENEVKKSISSEIVPKGRKYKEINFNKSSARHIHCELENLAERNQRPK